MASLAATAWTRPECVGLVSAGRGTEASEEEALDHERGRQDVQRVGDPDAGAIDPASDDPAAGIEAREFARTREEGGEAGLAGGRGALGAGGDASGDFGGLEGESDEGTPA